MLDAIGEIYRAQSFFFSGASAGYRGQIGATRRSRMRSPATSSSRPGRSS
jgi:hypothetical protein